MGYFPVERKKRKVLTLPRGEVMFALDTDYLDSTDHTKGRFWYGLGHVKGANLTVTPETKDHVDMAAPVSYLDCKAVTKIESKLTLEVDSVYKENMRYFLYGDSITELTQSSGSLTDLNLTLKAFNAWHELRDASGNRLYDISAVTITDDEATPNSLTEGEDYEVDYEHAMVIFYDDGPLSPALAVDDTLIIDATIPAATLYEIQGGGSRTIRRHIEYRGACNVGARQQVIGYGTIIPSGDLALVGDDFQTYNLEVTLLSHTDYGRAGFIYRDFGLVSC